MSEVEVGAFQTTLTHQTEPDWVSVVDRPLGSSQIHHGGFGTPNGAKLAKRRLCQHCFSEVDRDNNTEKETRYSSAVGPWQLETSPPFVPGSIYTGGISDGEMTHHLETKAMVSINTDHNWLDENDSWISDSKVQDENLVKGASS